MTQLFSLYFGGVAFKYQREVSELELAAKVATKWYKTICIYLSLGWMLCVLVDQALGKQQILQKLKDFVLDWAMYVR